MYYKKLKDGRLEIEFFNDWKGEEKVVVNGRVVSKKTSVWGVDHEFEAVVDGEKHYYILTTKVNDAMSVFVDLVKDGDMIQEDVMVPMKSKPTSEKNSHKYRGIALVKNFDLDDGISELQKAIHFSPKDPQIYLYLACAYSILEKPEEGFENLKLALENDLQDIEIIKTHEMLSYLRMHPAFDSFKESGYKEYSF